jgi:uncharacterized protein
MERELTKSLISWKDSVARQPLLLRGARQVGKTYLVEQFAKENFDRLIKINFEQQRHFCECFDSLDITRIIQEIELNSNELVEPGKTLLFLDEIQECPNAIKSLRYFFEKIPELHVIGAGSLLEFALSAEGFSMPVGRVQFLYLYPMSFSEVLRALDKDKLYDYLQEISLSDKIPGSIHQELLRLLYLYFMLGGMPRIIKLYIDSQKLLICREAQVSLLNSYRDDFGQYASKVQQRYCERVFSKSFELVAKNFKYTDIDPDMDYRSIKTAINLLFKANILYPIYYTKANGLPLSATQVEKKFKLLFLDLGLVQAAGRVPPDMIINQNLMQLNRGVLTEQFVGQHLLSMQPSYDRSELYYWQRDAKNSQAEIDYVFAVDNIIVPIEVKSGKSGRLKSLKSYLDSHKQSDFGVKISTDELGTDENILSIPLYMVEQLPRLIRAF